MTINAEVFKLGLEIFLNLVGKTQRGENPRNIPFPFKGSSFSEKALNFNKLNPNISAWSSLS